MTKTDFALQYVAEQRAGRGWEKFGRMVDEPEDKPEYITFRYDGTDAVYWLGIGQSVDDMARWFASAVGGKIAMYPVKVRDGLYELTDTLGDPPAELLDDGREDDLDAWLNAREAALLAGKA